MNDRQPPEQREFPDAFLCAHKDNLMNEVAKSTRDKQTRSRRSRSLVLRAGIAGALAVVALIVVSIAQIGGKGPLAPLAVDEALAVEKALDAITTAEGEVLHVKITDNGPDGSITRVESWTSKDAPGKYRQIWQYSHHGVVQRESATDYPDSGDGSYMVYDASTNTIFESRVTLSPAQAIKVNKGTGTYEELIRDMLSSGEAREDGHEQVGGRDAVRILREYTLDGTVAEILILVDPETGAPMEWRKTEFGETEITHFDLYEKLPGTPENLALLDLKEAHPGATVVTDPEAIKQFQTEQQTAVDHAVDGL